MALTFGLALQNDFPPHISPSARIGELREQTRAARDSGITSAWMLNHFLGNMQTLQPLVALAALAEHAGDMRLGTNMFILPLRHPVAVAEEFATLDQVTGGHAVAGLGMGYRSNEYEAFGISMDDRVQRYTESVELLRRLWSNEVVDFEGEHFTLKGESIGIPAVQDGGPPIWVGAGVHKAGARRAAALGDAWIVPPHAEPEKLRTILAFYADERERLGRGPAQEVVVRRELVLDPDAEKAREIGLHYRGENSRKYSEFEAPDQTSSYRHLKGQDGLADVADKSYLFCDPATAIEQLKELEDIGITHVILRMQWYDLPQDRMLQTLETFRNEVLPAFR
ncbi:LLM class flavin-dependent oxidoreductase [Pimelobacter simplex]|uniref:LLM class flavin-dependent oxidoreductase n=1 Tax=Nocardioides simplex TaxID=2045 RepID=UPI001932DD34|nr:LLM class flavin-dependent oxidoreductase [Pimelobacter simplex]